MCNHVVFPLYSSRWFFAAQGETTLLGTLWCFYLICMYEILYSIFLLVTVRDSVRQSVTSYRQFFAIFGFRLLRQLCPSYHIVVQLDHTLVL
jgi:hypothetical protein